MDAFHLGDEEEEENLFMVIFVMGMKEEVIYIVLASIEWKIIIICL